MITYLKRALVGAGILIAGLTSSCSPEKSHVELGYKGTLPSGTEIEFKIYEESAGCSTARENYLIVSKPQGGPGGNLVRVKIFNDRFNNDLYLESVTLQERVTDGTQGGRVLNSTTHNDWKGSDSREIIADAQEEFNKYLDTIRRIKVDEKRIEKERASQWIR